MNVLVTGGAGFIGSHLVQSLSKDNGSVTVIDNLSTGKKEYLNSNKINFIERNITKCRGNLNNFDAVFHLAAEPFSKEKVDWLEESKSIFKTNVTGTHNIFRLTNPNCHFVLISSASVYGEDRVIPEIRSYNPKSAYGYSKVLAEQVLLHSNRKNFTIVRPATVIGTRGRCFPNRVMWSLVHNKKCTFFKNGEVIRDIIDVRDMVTALTKIMEQKAYGIYNLGTNAEVRGNYLLRTAQHIAEENNLTFKGTTTPFVPDDFVVNSSLNSKKLYKKINWKPIFTLKESLKDIFNYYNLDGDTFEPPSWENL